MKKFHYYALAGAFMLLPATEISGTVPFEKGKHPIQRTAASSVANTNAFVKKAPASVTVVNEDFSRFSDGSEEAPGSEIINPDRYYISPDLTAQPGWTGKGLHPAGGSVLVTSYLYDAGYGDGPELTDGYISTPPMPLGGTLTITFRAKARTAGAELWVALCDDYYGPSDSESFYPGNEWAEYTIVTREASLEDDSYVQFRAMDYSEVFIDDIRLDLVRDKVATPTVKYATNLSDTEFIANWEENGAPEYLLSVWSIAKELNPEVGRIGTDFDGLTPDAENKNIPEGWTMNFSDKSVTTETGQYNSAPQAVVFDNLNDKIESPDTPYPITGISFWVKPSALTDNEYEMSLLRVEIYDADKDYWEPIAHLPYYWMEPDGGFYSFDSDALGSSTTRVRLSLIQKGLVDFYIDDLTIEYTKPGKRTDIMVDEKFTSSGVTVTGIDPTADTYYSVKASIGDITSAPSPRVWVDGLTGLKVTTKEGTNVTSDSFTANWEALGHADSYKVEAYAMTHATQDIDEVVILEESFDNINEGTTDVPGTSWDSPFDFSSKGWASTGWSATQPAWATGMAGTTGTSWYGGAGLIYTPMLDLGCNAGEGFDVEMTVYTTVADLSDYGSNEKEGVYAMVLRTPNDTQSMAAGLLDTPVVGLTTGRIHVDTRHIEDLSNVIVAFMNKSGLSFFVDNVRITQPLLKGEKLNRPYAIATTAETSIDFRTLESATEHSYRVTASATREYITYTSDPSDLQVVLATSAIEDIKATDNSQVTAANGVITVSAHSDSTPWSIYTPSGIAVASGTGSSETAVTPGIYIVRLGSSTTKLCVK